MGYKTIPSEDFCKEFPTWIIAFCPDTLSFFVTNQRYFFWEYEKEFESEEEGIKYFKENREYFRKIFMEIMKNIDSYFSDDRLLLDNTEELL